MILGQFLTLENMVEKFFQNSNFSDFLGIKSEVSQYEKTRGTDIFFRRSKLSLYGHSQNYCSKKYFKFNFDNHLSQV